MTSQFKTLDDIVAAIQYRGNLGGYEARHPVDTIKDLWNDSNQRLREIVATHDDSPYLKRTTPATLPIVAAVTDEVYAEVDWPTNALSIHSVRVLSDDGYWRPIKEIMPGALHDFQEHFFGLRQSQEGLPHAYTVGNLPSGSGTSEVAGTIQLVPIPTAGKYSVWYIENWTPITTGTSVVNSVAAWLEWTIWDVVVKTTGKNGKGGHTYNNAIQERDLCMKQIEGRARRLSASGDIEARNARGDGYRPRGWGEDY